MIRRHVLAALDVGITAHDEDAARVALRRIDPIARGLARRTLERSLIDAALACDAEQITAPPADHVMRLAALGLAKKPADVRDVAGTAAAYAQLPARKLSRVPLLTIASVVFLAAFVGFGALYVQHALEKPSRTYAKKLPPPSADAYAKGGVPLTDPAVDKLLTEELTKLVVEGGKAKNHEMNSLASVLDGLYAPDPFLKRGVALTKAWGHMLDVFNQSTQVEVTEHANNELAESVRDFTAQLHAAGLGYVLEGRFKNGYPYIQAYRVVEIVFVTTAGTPRRVLSIRRLDKLSSAYAVLGMHEEDLDPVLHLERIDENVATDVLPVLADGASYPLADREWMLTEPGKSLAAKVGDTVRREYKAALGNDAGTVDEIAKLLTKRNDIVDEWRDHLLRKHIYFVRTENLFLPPNLLEQLEDVTPNYQRRRVREIEERLAEIEAPRIHARIHEMVAATVRRHEAQHGFDYDRDTELRYPSQLQDFLGSPHDSSGNPVPVVRSARAELSAYLSQVANDPVTPQAAVWHLGAQVFNRDRRGTGEYYAGIVLIEGLARHLGAQPDGSRYVSREALAPLAIAIANAPADKLRAAAQALCTDLYGEPVTPIVDAPPRNVLAQAQ
ncbi:MAG TPA: hypothetical protein VFV99_07865 [Kofleriaceae bacterium]|nr:hypothetical protein [Kofleriaceae bacterium]